MNVARPVVAQDRVDRRGGDALHAPGVLRGVVFDEVVEQQQHVGVPLAERRQAQTARAELTVGVLARAAVLDRQLQGLVGGSDQPHVDPGRLEVAGPLELMAAAACEPELRPGMVSVIQTFGDRINPHPHVHALVTRGG
jgi:hypothetical protein